MYLSRMVLIGINECVEIVHFDATQETNQIYFTSDHNWKCFSGYQKTEIGHKMIRKVIVNLEDWIGYV